MRKCEKFLNQLNPNELISNPNINKENNNQCVMHKIKIINEKNKKK